jgi:tellurite resistance protein TerC
VLFWGVIGALLFRLVFIFVGAEPLETSILGLRSLYFCLAGLLRRFVHLHHGLAVLLAFAGAKLILSETPVGKLPIPVTLGVIVVTIAVSIGWSLRSTRGDSVDVDPTDHPVRPPSWKT